MSAAAASLELSAQTEPQPQPSTHSYRKSLRLSSDQIVSLLYLYPSTNVNEALSQLALPSFI